MQRKMDLLPQISFSILMALSLKPRHGYEIMKQAEEDSLGKIKMGPGALYTAIKQLVEEGLIEETDSDNKDRRRYYKLTKRGWDRLNAELEYYNNVVKIAKHRTAYESLGWHGA
jgi:DNA-binding PadR family transcriptional regulator